MNGQRPIHTPMTQFPVIGECLSIGGMPLTRLADRVGRTPFYAYDRQLISERITLLRTKLPSAIQLHYVDLDRPPELWAE